MTEKKVIKRSVMTFADMLYQVEQLLIKDSAFRNRMQERFSHIIVDEAQDVGGQALRILVTISFDPGRNDIYENFNPLS